MLRANGFPRRGRRATPAMLALSLALGGCSAANAVGNFFVGGPTNNPATTQPTRITGFLGGVAADEPQAALIGRDVLANGGTAADAAVAMGFALSVTYPSRASLGAGGACLAYDPSRDGPGQGNPEAIMFTPLAPAHLGPNADRPASVPMLARGLYLLYARYGTMPFERLIAPAERMARLGVPVSRAFASDLALVAGPLFADPNARAVFAGPTGQPLTDGQTMVQPALGATLAQLRINGVGDLYQGQLAQKLAAASIPAGGGLTLTDIWPALPKVAAPITLADGHDDIAFLPPPADGGLAAAAAFGVLEHDPRNIAGAQARAMAVAARWRQAGGDPMALLRTDLPPGTLPALPASTSFVTLDRAGRSVACSVTMDNLFGTGRIAPGTGILLAASPGAVPLPLLAAAIAWNPNLHAFRAAVGGAGQEAAPLAVATAMSNTLQTQKPMAVPVPDPGRANVIACSRYLPGSRPSCGWATDPRGSGLAAGSS